MKRIHNLVGRPTGDASDAQACLRRGQAFAKAGKLYLENRSDQDDGAPYIVCSIQAIELLLKSFLRSTGVTFNIMSKRPLGHDLSALSVACEEKGLELDLETKWVISEISKFSTSKTFEYVEQLYFSHPQLPNEHSSAKSLPEAMDRALINLAAKIEEKIPINPAQDAHYPNQSI